MVSCWFSVIKQSTFYTTTHTIIVKVLMFFLTFLFSCEKNTRKRLEGIWCQVSNNKFCDYIRQLLNLCDYSRMVSKIFYHMSMRSNTSRVMYVGVL